MGACMCADWAEPEQGGSGEVRVGHAEERESGSRLRPRRPAQDRPPLHLPGQLLWGLSPPGLTLEFRKPLDVLKLCLALATPARSAVFETLGLTPGFENPGKS